MTPLILTVCGSELIPGSVLISDEDELSVTLPVISMFYSVTDQAEIIHAHIVT